MDLEAIDIPAPPMRWGSGERAGCLGAYKAIWQATDCLGVTKKVEVEFYALERPGQSCILGMPALHDAGIELDTSEMRWRFKSTGSQVQLVSAEELLKEDPASIFELRSEDIAPILSVDEFDEGEPTTISLPPEFEDFKDDFDDKLAARMPTAEGAEHAIETTADPPFGKMYNLSVKELGILRQYLRDATASGWIRPSTSPAGAGILFVPKKGGDLRLCVDYRGLNKVTIKNRHALPLISELLDRLQGARYYTKLDMKNAYYRIRIRPGDEWKTAFRTRYGHFEYLVMPFGLANAPATFQAYINKALSGLVDSICVVYLDDVMIYSKTRSEHVRHVREVLTRLRQFGLYSNLKKCKFFTEEVEFLGFIVNTSGVQMDRKRVATIAEWPEPKTYTEVQVFLGFCNFYRRFIARYSRIVAPLTELFKGSKNGKQHGPFRWPVEAAHAFRTLIEAFTTAPLLRHFDPNRRLRIETDASAVAAAAILTQPQDTGHWHPIAFWSRKLTPAERNYKTYEQELLAIVAAFSHWRHYLEGSIHPIEVLTDHNNLLGFSELKQLNGRQARWTMLLAAYDFVITHRPGAKNPADAPSRRPDYEAPVQQESTLLPTLQKKLGLMPRMAVVESLTTWQTQGVEMQLVHTPHKGAAVAGRTRPDSSAYVSQLSSSDAASWVYQIYPISSQGEPAVRPGTTRVRAREVLQGEHAYADPSNVPLGFWELQCEDPTVRKVHAELLNEPIGPHQWSRLVSGCITFRGKIFVPNDAAVRQELLRLYHDDAFAGHFGVARTHDLLARKYFWTHMSRDVDEYVKTCEVCQRTKVKRHAPFGDLQPLPQPEGPWQELTMDFMSGVPASKVAGRAYDALLVLLDRYTKMALYIPVTKKLTAADLAEILVDRVFTRFGAPRGIVSDRDSRFTGSFWSELCYYARIKRRLSTAFHPQTDGQTERQNQTIQEYLRAFCSENQGAWAKLLPVAEFAYNNSKHSSTGISPFMAMYGYNPEIHFNPEERPEGREVPAAKDRIEGLYLLRSKLAVRWQEATEAQSSYYNKKHKPMQFNKGDLVLVSTKNLRLKTPSKKLSQRMMGPFRVIEPVGSQAYRLQLPPTMKIHPVFGVPLLEKYHQRAGEDIEHLPLPELVEGEEEWEVEEIVDARRKGAARQYLVKWVGYPEDFNQWTLKKDMGNSSKLIKEFESRAVRIEPVQAQRSTGNDPEELGVRRSRRHLK
ncbi:hypothetical protein E6O75_ATG11708 [Venturia nashicola]|uniref:Reverse transcriptase n=1 Tax=Venturia nashicola TaxID=86259 RepID=A0A4Z1NLU0_9PEZI|nr:hypothetical protein E6O75_ATG11708 [Venturia nashicola]